MTLAIHGARKVDAEGHAADFWLVADGARILATGTGDGWREHECDTVVDAAGDWLVPGFIDLHNHGGGGNGFDKDAAQIARGLAVHRAHGTTRSMVSLVSAPLAQLRESLAVVAEVAGDDPLVLGAHLEGPFLADSRRGAHNREFLRTPDLDTATAFLDAAQGTLRQMTLAPELPHALDVVDLLVDRGVRVAVGHTEADEATAQAAFDHGASLLTHAFNAMPGIHHRRPGPVVAAIEDERVTLELVLDGLHVHPHVARLAFRLAPGRVALITDAMAAAGVGDGDYRLGSLNVTVSESVAMLSGTDTIAGSTLTLDTALRIAIARIGLDPVRAVTALTLTPARALGIDDRFGLLAPGYVADAVLLDERLEVRTVWADGATIDTDATPSGKDG